VNHLAFQSVMEECGPNHMTRRLDKAQQQLEITLEHMETTLQAVQNHQVNMNNTWIHKINNKIYSQLQLESILFLNHDIYYR